MKKVGRFGCVEGIKIKVPRKLQVSGELMGIQIKTVIQTTFKHTGETGREGRFSLSIQSFRGVVGVLSSLGYADFCDSP